MLDPLALEHARFGFDRMHPQRSAKLTVHWTQILAAAALAIATLIAAAEAPGLAFGVFHFAALSFFAATILWRLVAAARSRRLHAPFAARAQWPTYTILCPLYREANVVAELVAALGRIDYPSHKLDVKLLVEEDDPATIAAACQAAASAPQIEVVVVPPAAPRTKPKALNAGLARARGEFLCVFDAEDRPHPEQLRAALAAFDAGDETLACVQAPLAIENSNDSWIARQFAAEYAIQFTQALPLLARLGMPLPLGGTSNHFRTDALHAVGGWDPFNVTDYLRRKHRAFSDVQGGAIFVPLKSQTRNWSAKCA